MVVNIPEYAVCTHTYLWGRAPQKITLSYIDLEPLITLDLHTVVQ